MVERCAQCGSERVVPKAIIWDQGRDSSGTLQAYVYANPDAVLFKGTAYATLYARICAECGHTSLFAEGAEALYEALLESQSEGDGEPHAQMDTTEEACLSCGKAIPAGAESCPGCGWSWGTAEEPA